MAYFLWGRPSICHLSSSALSVRRKASHSRGRQKVLGAGLLAPGFSRRTLEGFNFGALRSTPGLVSLSTDPDETEDDFGDAAVRLEGLG